MWRTFKRLWKRTDGAVAPTIALSMVGLIAAGGIAFDYAHLVTMDTELQQAADQAALAAATQLDRDEGSRDRAVAAIDDGTAANRLARNLTRFSNDGAGAAVEIDSVIFCSSFNDGVADTDAACEETTDDAEARFVIVRTSLRTANYTLTPVVGAISGTSRAEAVAGVETAICNVAPLFICTEDDSFPDEDDIGMGMVLRPGGGNAWAAGNYGLLDFNPSGAQGNPASIEALLGNGLNGCLATPEVDTQTGVGNVTDAINTRFDHYAGNPATDDPAVCDLSSGSGCPSENTGKDLTLTMTYTKSTARTVTTAPADDQICGATGGTISYADAFVENTAATGFPRDTCHYGSCAENPFGDKIWDAAAYMAANHPGVDVADVPSEAELPTRYEVYLWELEDKDARLAPQQIGTTEIDSKNGPQQTTIWTYTKTCTFSEPKLASAAYPAQKDRRILPIIAADCDALNGHGSVEEDFRLIRVFDVFLTQPSLPRNAAQEANEIYAEVIGPAQPFESGSGLQYYTRNRPYLLR